MKFLPACVGLLTLASCSSDDFLGGKSNELDLSDKVVLEVTDGDAAQMRGYAASNYGIVFEEGDIMRVYDSKLQKYDNFVFPSVQKGETGYFVLPEGKTPLVDQKTPGGDYDYTYAIYGAADNEDGKSNISYAGWMDGSQVALMNIQSVYTYEENPASYQSGGKMYTAWKSILPSVGYVTQSTSEVAKGRENFKTTVYSLAGRARIVFENGAGLNVKRVRARAVKFVGENTAEAFETVTPQTGASTYAAKVTDDNAPYLSGWFEAVLDGFNETTHAYEGEGLRPLTDKEVINNGNAKNFIVANVDIDEDSEFNNVVFFPIVPGEYELILFEYSTKEQDSEDATVQGQEDSQKDEDWYYIASLGGEVTRTTSFQPAAITTAFDLNTKELIPGQDLNDNKGLQDALAPYLAYNKNIAVNVNGKIKVGGSNYAANWYTLNLNLQNDLTLNISEIAVEGTDNVTLNINNTGTGKLTINYTPSAVADATPTCTIKVNAAGDLELGGTYANAIEVTNAAGLKLGGSFNSKVTIANATSLALDGTFDKAVTTPEGGISGNIAIAGTYKAGATLQATDTITTGAVTNGTETVKLIATNIEIAGQIGKIDTRGKVHLTTGGRVIQAWAHREGDLTVDGQVPNGTMTVQGGVLTVNKGGYIKTLSLSGATSATITGDGENTMSTLTTTSTPVTLNNVKVTTLNVKAAVTGDAGITLNGGTVTTLNGYDEGTVKTTIKSVGTVDIKTVNTDNNLKFTSEIDKDTKAVDVADAATINIYTGAQLLSLKGATTVNATTINLNTDVTATNVEWTPSAILKNNATTFDGKKHQIVGLNIVTDNTKKNTAFFSEINNSSKVTVKDLTISGLSYDGETTSLVAGLVGTINSSADITNVLVAGNKLYGTKDVFCVGGMVARASNGEINITGSTVNFEEIAGKQYVGGLIGDDGVTATHTPKITIKVGENQTDPVVTVTKLTSSADATAANIATFGMLVGAIRDYGKNNNVTELTIIGSKDKLYKENKIAEHRSSYLYDKNTYEENGATFKFLGVDDNYVGFCPAYAYRDAASIKKRVEIEDATKVKIGTSDSNAKYLTSKELNQFIVSSSWTE